MKFSDLKFKPHPTHSNDGVQALHFFPNGYGVSIVKFPHSYGYEDGLYEIAVLEGDETEFELCYDTPVADDVLGYLDEATVEDVLSSVSALTKNQVKNYVEWRAEFHHDF